MNKPIGRKNNMRTPEEKEKIVLEYLNGCVGYRVVAESYGLAPKRFFIWIKKYREKGIEGLISKTGKSSKKGINKGRTKKPKTREEQLERENAKLKVEIERLKKGYYVKGVGQRKEYVSISNRNIKSSEN